MLTEKDIIYQRGEDGELISQSITLEGIEGNPSVKVKPLTRGKLQEVYNKATSEDNEEKVQAESDIIIHGLVEPKLSKDRLNDLKPQYAGAIVTAIMAVSLGITQKEVGDKANEILISQELKLKKK